MSSPNVPQSTRVVLRAAVGREGQLVWGVVTFDDGKEQWTPQSYYADVNEVQEVSAFYDDMTHAIRQQAKSICEAVYDLSCFDPPLIS
jgi:hypothetical protein